MNANAASIHDDPEFLPRLELASMAVVYVPGLLGEPVDQDEAAGVAAWARQAANSHEFGAAKVTTRLGPEARATLFQIICRIASLQPR